MVSLVPDELPDYVNDNPIIEMDEGERRIEMDDSGPVPVCPPAVSIINCHHSSDLLKTFSSIDFFFFFRKIFRNTSCLFERKR